MAGVDVHVPSFRRSGILVLIMIGLMPSADVRAQSQQDLFSKVFGAKQTPKEQRFRAPIDFLIYELGLVSVVVKGEKDPVLVDKQELRQALEKVVVKPALEAFDTLETTDGMIPTTEVSDAGFTLVYEPASLSLALDIPWELQSVHDVSLAASVATVPDSLGPAPTSAILNLRGSFDITRDEALVEQSDPTFALNMDGAFRLQGAVLEAEADVSSDLESGAQLLRLRLFYDHVPSRLRLEAGDVEIATTGFQSVPRILGIAAAREFDLQPDRPFRPRGSRMLIIERDSVIEVIANGRVIDTFPLSPGRYRITDLPLNVGGNDFTIRITDDLGQEESVDLSLFFDPGLLGQGEQDYGYAIGFETRVDGAYQSVDTDRWVLSAFHRQGVSDALTLGVSGQSARRRLNLGGQVGLASRLGNIDVLTEWSLASERTGTTVTLQWEKPNVIDPASGWNVDFGLSASYTSALYVPFDPEPLTPEENEQAFDTAVRLAYGFPGGWLFSVTGEQEFDRDGGRDTGVTTGLRKDFAFGASVDFFSTLTNQEGIVDHIASIGLSFPLGPRHTVESGAAFPDRSYRASVTRRPRRAVNDWTGTFTASGSETEDVLDANGRYIAQRGEIDVQLTETFQKPNGVTRMDRDLRHRAAVTLGTSLLYAGGSVAVGRPVVNSFALVRRHPNLSTLPITVNPEADAYLARSDGLGPLVIPNLSDYVLQQIRLEAPDLKVGQDLGDERPFIRPGARSGVVVTAGTDASVILTARLVDGEGAPHALKAGDLVRLDDQEAKEPVSFFTNRRGRIAIEGLKPGRYRLSLYLNPRVDLEIEIAPDETGLFRAGIIMVTP